MNKKVVVIALDGATFDVIGPWIKKGTLANLAKIVKNGVSGELESVFPPVTPTAWASFMTGKNPGKHSVMDFDLHHTSSYERKVVDSTKIEGETLWKSLSKANKKVGVVHVPLTHPPEKVNGFILTDYIISPSLTTYPSDLAKEILLKVPGYKRIYSDVLLVSHTLGLEDEYIKSVYEATDKEKEVSFYLMEKNKPDFFMSHFYWGDQIQHRLWKYFDSNHPAYDNKNTKKYGNVILNYYKKIDDMIGQLQKKLDEETTLIIMSDHGFGPLYKRVYINHWLMNLGLLKLRKSKRNFTKNWMSKLGFSREDLLTLARKHDILKFLITKTPRSLIGLIYRNTPMVQASLNDIDFARTKAYSAGHVGQIFINQKGRDPEGIVPKENYEDLLRKITTELLELKDPKDGKKIVDRVFRKDEIYEGPYTDLAADLLFIMRNMSYITQSSLVMDLGESEFGTDKNSLIKSPESLTAWHRMNGIFMAIGPDLGHGIVLENVRIIDIAPTILHIFDVPIQSDVDGRVLIEIFKSESDLANKKIRYCSSKSERREEYRLNQEEEEEIKKRLKRLGYF